MVRACSRLLTAAMNCFVLSLFAVMGTITVTAAQTLSYEELSIIDDVYIKHTANKYWTYAQCPYLLNGGIRTYTASKETCEADCNNHQECTAFNHYYNPLGGGRCELKKCPIPAPDPSGTADGWIGYSLQSECKYLTAQLNDLDNSPVTAMERKEILLKKIKSCPIVQAEVPVKQFAKEITEYWIANVNYIQSGQIAMSALQRTKVIHFPPHSPPAYLQFDSVASIPDHPNQIFLSLEHNDNHLGDVIITLDGDISYPRLGKQMLELATGNNRKQGSWRGAGFTSVTKYNKPAEHIVCDHYTRPDGQNDSTPLFPVEKKGVPTEILAGQVRATPLECQDKGLCPVPRASWLIITKDGSPNEKSTDPIIGHVTSSSMKIIKRALDVSEEYVKHVTFSNTGLVIIDETSKIK